MTVRMYCVAGALFILVACFYPVQVAGVCEDGFWGENCTETCGNCANSTTCDQQSGECPSGCEWGWIEPMCNQGCSSNFWGPNCSVSCGNCFTNVPCDTETGACVEGCAPGWSGDTCYRACWDGQWGQNCSETCGNCLTFHPCDKDDGTCGGGCLQGWEPPTCKTQSSTQQENTTQQDPLGGTSMNVASYSVIVLVNIAFLGHLGYLDVIVSRNF